MKFLKKLVLNEDRNSNILKINIFYKDALKLVILNNDLLKYKKISISCEFSYSIVILKLEKNCSNILKNIYFSHSNEPDKINIFFNENDYMNFSKIIYNTIKFYHNTKHKIIFKFINHKTNSEKVLQNCYDYFVNKEQLISIEEIEEYLEDHNQEIEEPKTLSIEEIAHRIDNGLIIKDSNVEKMIKDNPKLSFFYARYILQGRFPEGETAIATDANYSLLYAMGEIDGRFPKGEKVISETEWAKLQYNKFLKLKGEKEI